MQYLKSLLNGFWKKVVSRRTSRQVLKKYADKRTRRPRSVVVPKPSLAALQKEYRDKGLDRLADTFALYRIIGNDLHPRHKKGQSRANLRFILEHEPEFPLCEKLFVLNRIIDQEEEQAIVKLLDQHQQPYVRIPFKAEEYRAIGWDMPCLPEPGFLYSADFAALKEQSRYQLIAALYRLKNNYVMNNNGARNTALQHGKERAKWILPWDGNCFLTMAAWDQMHADILASRHLKYFAVPMARVLDNASLLDSNFAPDPVEEPQLVFRLDAAEVFNEDFCYGRRPKVELFWRLGIPGKWDRWKDDPWDRPRKPLAAEAGQFGTAGWVARLFSGNESLEQGSKESFHKRGAFRLRSVLSTLQEADVRVAGMTNWSFTSFDSHVLDQQQYSYLTGTDPLLSELISKLVVDTDTVLER